MRSSSFLPSLLRSGSAQQRAHQWAQLEEIGKVGRFPEENSVTLLNQSTVALAFGRTHDDDWDVGAIRVSSNCPHYVLTVQPGKILIDQRQCRTILRRAQQANCSDSFFAIGCGVEFELDSSFLQGHFDQVNICLIVFGEKNSQNRLGIVCHSRTIEQA